MVSALALEAGNCCVEVEIVFGANFVATADFVAFFEVVAGVAVVIVVVAVAPVVAVVDAEMPFGN